MPLEQMALLCCGLCEPHLVAERLCRQGAVLSFSWAKGLLLWTPQEADK